MAIDLGQGTGISYDGYINSTGSTTTVSITGGNPTGTTIVDAESLVIAIGFQIVTIQTSITITKVG
jgi:hypothetical protein